MNDKLFRAMAVLSLVGVLAIGGFIALGGLESVMPLANTTIEGLTELTIGPAAGDVFIMDDVSNSNATRKITAQKLFSHTLPITVENTIVDGTFTVSGIADFNGAVYMATLKDTDAYTHLTFVTNARTSTGTTVASTHSLSSLADVLISGKLEVDGVTYLDAGAIISGSHLTLEGSPVAQTITDGTEDIAPTTSYHLLTAGGAVANTMSVSGYSKGDVVILVNEAAQTITITDTGTTMLSATYGMAQYDTLSLLFDGTNWLETGRSNN